MSPLHDAARQGHLGIVKIFVEHGASLSLQDRVSGVCVCVCVCVCECVCVCMCINTDNISNTIVIYNLQMYMNMSTMPTQSKPLQLLCPPILYKLSEDANGMVHTKFSDN